MLVTVRVLKAAGIELPIFFCGAVLTRKVTETNIASEYSGIVHCAKCAMEGLELANRLMDGEERLKLAGELRRRRERASERTGGGSGGPTAFGAEGRSSVRRDVPVFEPPDF